MAFRLKHRHGISKELKRILRAEFRTALASLDVENPSEEAIHEARISLKKIRAVLRLLQDPLGASYATENRRLREASHGLAPIRDADARLETLRLIHGKYSTVVTQVIARDIAHGLESQQQTKAQASRLLAPALRQLRRSQETVPDRIGRVGRFSAVRRGVERAYRRAREAMEKVGTDSDATQFHAWRRRVKTHTYHVRLFRTLHSTPRSRVRSLERLATCLGDDHNLALLRSTILEMPDKFGDARTTALVLGCIVKAQAWRRQEALKLGRRLFGRKPSQFRQAVAEWWVGPPS